MQILNNTTEPLADDLKKTITPKSRIDIAAACFSLYAFDALKKQLKNTKEVRFLFTSPTFTTNKPSKNHREFYIPRRDREQSLYGTEFELKLRNEMTQKAIAKECAEWIRKKVTFKSNITSSHIAGFITVRDAENEITYQPINGFTAADLGANQTAGSANLMPMVLKLTAPLAHDFMRSFDELWRDKNRLQDVTNEVIESISAAYRENSPEYIYFVALYNIFNEFLEDISDDILPNEATGFKESAIWNMLYNFQKDAALAIISKLEKYNGCILADSVGLGKTFTALSIIKYYENKNRNVLVLCPKKLSGNWTTYKANYTNNPIYTDRLRYDVLYHTDLSRDYGMSNGIDLERINWGNYDLVVIDESHNFRSGARLDLGEGDKENRYYKLLNNVIRKGVKTKVLMLSATPVNTRFVDLRNQLQLAYEGDVAQIDEKLNTKRSINDVFRNAQAVFNQWSGLAHTQRTTDALLKMLDFDFFEVLDSVTIARSRKHIERYYDTSDIGTFPTRLKPITQSPSLTDLPNSTTYDAIFESLMQLSLSIYTPTQFILPSKMQEYADKYGDNKVNIGFTQANRESGIRRLTAINLMKRMESSVHSFSLTLERIRSQIQDMIAKTSCYAVDRHLQDVMVVNFSHEDMDASEEGFNDFYTTGKKISIQLKDMDYVSWEQSLKYDLQILNTIKANIDSITEEHDNKLQTLLHCIRQKQEKPINKQGKKGNKKIIIFTAFADTAVYLYKHVAPYVKEHFSLHTAMVTGSIEGKTTVRRLRPDLNTVLSHFSPISKNATDLSPKQEIDILIATDCISEGQNLQDCDYLINYDIHWNPVRIIQRFGRIDRIGSQNAYIQLVNFWPNISLDAYINLKSRVESRMKIVDMAATGDDNLLSDGEKIELEYRKEQLKRLQEEVVDIEEMSQGISIMDLGLNEFRLDLLEYCKKHDDLHNIPLGLHAVVEASPEAPAGVLYILRNRTESININNKNNLHPFYMVYIKDDGEVLYNHLAPREILKSLRTLCKGQTEPHMNLCAAFNRETKEGKDMRTFSDLLGKSIASIIDVKDQSAIQGFLSGDMVSFVHDSIQGLDDFELVCFLAVKEV